MKFIKPSNYFNFSVILLLALVSCQDNAGSNSGNIESSIFSSKIQVDNVTTKLKEKVESIKVDTNTKQTVIWLKEAYVTNEFKTFWLNKGGVEDQVKEYLSSIDSLQYDGLTISDYHIDSLKQVAHDIEDEKITSVEDLSAFELAMSASFIQVANDLAIGKKYKLLANKDWKIKNDSAFNAASLLKENYNKGNIAQTLYSLRPNHAWYTKFRNEYIRLHNHSLDGGWPTLTDLDDSVKVGFQSAQIPLLRVRLNKEINEPIDTISTTWDENLSTSIKKYQFQHQLKGTGILDSATLNALNKGIGDKLKTLALNMERMRWMRKDFPQPYIWVDIPKMELDYVDHDSVAFNMRVVVGRKARPTPALKSKIENIVLSPPWTVPPTIMKEEVVPGLARKGGSYLARRGLKAYRGGRPVNPAMINAKNYKQFAISQAPGYRSSLGEVKFNMINPWAIYLHDTPHREDFVKAFRAFSSGCIRVHKPKQFAEFLLQDSVKYSYQKIDSICKKRTTLFIPFNRQVDVHIVYLTNAIDSAGNVMYLKDVYGWD